MGKKSEVLGMVKTRMHNSIECYFRKERRINLESKRLGIWTSVGKTTIALRCGTRNSSVTITPLVLGL